MTKLPTELQTAPFTLAQAIELGLTFYELNKLVSLGTLENIGRGVYRISGLDISEEDQYKIATLRMGTRSAICLVSALSSYGLTDEIPRKTWILVPAEKRSTYKDLKIIRSRNPRWKIGIEKFDGYSITTVERTLVESLTSRSRLGSQIGLQAFRKALSSKKTTLGKIMDMAVQLKVSHKILPYIEAQS